MGRNNRAASAANIHRLPLIAVNRQVLEQPFPHTELTSLTVYQADGQKKRFVLQHQHLNVLQVLSNYIIQYNASFQIGVI